MSNTGPSDAPPQALYRTRTDVLFAASAPLAVVVRRGPRRNFSLVLWDLQRDAFERGQWMSGVIRVCDLSPDGKLFAYWAAQYHGRPWHRHRLQADGEKYDAMSAGATERAMRLRRQGRKVPKYVAAQVNQTSKPARLNTGSWTAVSRPPFFTALAIWPSIGTWTGGAALPTSRRIELFEAADGLVPIANVAIPRWLEVSGAGCCGIWSVASRRSAHVPDAEPAEPRQRVAAVLRASGCKYVDWVSLRQAPHLLFSVDGAIYRLPNWENVSPTDYLRQARQLIDLSGDRFVAMAAPEWALSWDRPREPQGP